MRMSASAVDPALRTIPQARAESAVPPRSAGSAPAPPARAAPSGWLWGPAPDLLLGCGLGYLGLVALLSLLSPSPATMVRIYPWIPLVILVTGIPHYGATLLRVYASAESRRRYATTAYSLGAVVWIAFVAAIHLPPLGCALITLYLSWSPWHYAAQNYGLTCLFLHRRGVTVSPSARRLLRSSFALSFGAILLHFHTAASPGTSDPLFAGTAAYRFLSAGVPVAFARVAVPALAVLQLVTTVAAFAMLWRSGRDNLRALLPSAVLILTQAIWFTLPSLADQLAPRPGEYAGAARAFVWVAIGHAVQYLWISAHYARASGVADSRSAWLAKTVLLGAAVWTVPTFVFAPAALGRVPFELGLALLVAAAVNLHHFLLDGAIWRLRDQRVGAVLLGQSGPAPAEAAPRRAFPAAARVAIYSVGVLGAAAWILATWEEEIGRRRAVAAGDLPRVAAAAERLAVIGRDGPAIHTALGRLAARAGDADLAVAEFERSLALGPSAPAWVGLGRLRERTDLSAARDAYEAALALDPNHLGALGGSALAWLRLGDLDRARAASDRAMQLAPEREAVRRRHAQILAAGARAATRDGSGGN